MAREERAGLVGDAPDHCAGKPSAGVAGRLRAVIVGLRVHDEAAPHHARRARSHGDHVQFDGQLRAAIGVGAAEAGRAVADIDTWWIACLDVSEQRDEAFEKLGNILAFVAAYVVGPDPAARGVPAELQPAIAELRKAYSTRRADMDVGLVRRLGLLDYLRTRLAVAGTPDDCVEQVRSAVAAGARQLMFTVSLAADPVRTVDLFGARVLPRVRAAVG